VKFSKLIWDQLKNLSADDLISALDRDGFKPDIASGSQRIYKHPDGKRVSVHYHAGKTFGPNLLKSLFADIGWFISDLRRLKLMK
jgi:predicted RNA binding protein YcfA (HicA-like mRNA interferase family)